MIERSVKYFDVPGAENTQATIDAVHAFVREGNEAAAVIVASLSGRTALKVRRQLENASVPVICVTGSPSWQTYSEYAFPLLSDELREDLGKADVAIVDCVPSSLSDTVEFSFARYGFRSPTWILVETLLAVGGYGLKTAVEGVLMATDGGFVAPFKDVVAVAGTRKGADTAIVARSTFSSAFFSSDPEKRLVIKEVLAMPRNKHFYKDVRMGEWDVREVD